MQTFMSSLTAHSENQFTAERNISCLTTSSCSLLNHPHHLLHLSVCLSLSLSLSLPLSLSFSLSLSLSHTHTHTSFWPCLSFHVKETSFSALVWDMWGTLVKAFSLLQSVQFNGSGVSDSLRTFDWSTSVFTIHHQLPELDQTQAHQVGDAIQPSHILSSPSALAFNLSWPQGLFQWVSSLP